MFTGIIEAVGEVNELQARESTTRVRIRTGALDLGDVSVGDSIAVNGVCLTVAELPGDGFWADVSRETLARTAFYELRRGQRVNLEKALRLSDRLGGHLVSGHVDGVGAVIRRSADGTQLRIRAPEVLARYIAEKGSICVDGACLTVNAVHGAEFDVALVPHTLKVTTLDECVPGHKVNLEVDLIARYLERLLQSESSDA